ncbi:MAG: hypothetical protein JWO82_2524 [Akkermansiaceae bacterium]|nr:hypothetical protein [Akkermansiaceae bacterium]
MKHTIILPCLGLLALASANAQSTPTPKPGTVAPAVLQATIVNETGTTSSVTGGVRTTYTSATTRISNREILGAMAVATAASPTAVPPVVAGPALLDGSIAGWSIARVADATGAGKLYAIKAGKAAVAVPVHLLIQPVVTGQSRVGTVVVPTTGATTTSTNAKAYGTASVLNGTASVSGTDTLKSAVLKTGTTSTVVLARTENYTIIGQRTNFTGLALAGGTVNASFRIPRSTPTNLVTLFPGTATP